MLALNLGRSQNVTFVVRNKHMEKQRDCFKCIHYRICSLRWDIDDFLKKSSGILNINGDGAPGTTTGIYEALARACIEFTPREAEDDNAIKNT